MAVDMEQLKQLLTPPQQPAPAGTNPQDWQSANNQAFLKYGGQEVNLYGQLESINQFLERDIKTQQNYGQLADEKLASIATQLKGGLQQNADAIGNIYAQGQKGLEGIWGEAQTAVGGAGKEVQDILSRNAGIIGQSTGDALPKLQAKLQELQATTASSKAGSLANLLTLGTQMHGLAQQRVGNVQSEYGQKRADLQKGVQSAITQLQIETQGDARKILQQIGVLAAQKSVEIQETLNALGQARSKAEHDAIMDILDRQDKEAEIAIKWERLALDKAKLGVEQQKVSGKDMLSALKVQGQQLTNQKKAIEIDKLLKPPGPANTWQYLNQWLEKKTARGPVKGAIRDLIKEALNQGMGNSRDAYDAAMQLMAKGDRNKFFGISEDTGKVVFLRPDGNVEKVSSNLVQEAIEAYFNTKIKTQ